MKELKSGDKLQKNIVVKRDHLACVVGSGDLPVLATPMVIAFMEGVAAELIGLHFDDDYTSVGIKINVDHLAPTLEGGEIIAEARLDNISGRKYEFSVSAYDNAGLIAEGRHIRVMVQKDKFLDKAEQRSNIIPEN